MRSVQMCRSPAFLSSITIRSREFTRHSIQSCRRILACFRSIHSDCDLGVLASMTGLAWLLVRGLGPFGVVEKEPSGNYGATQRRPCCLACSTLMTDIVRLWRFGVGQLTEGSRTKLVDWSLDVRFARASQSSIARSEFGQGTMPAVPVRDGPIGPDARNYGELLGLRSKAVRGGPPSSAMIAWVKAGGHPELQRRRTGSPRLGSRGHPTRYLLATAKPSRRRRGETRTVRLSGSDGRRSRLQLGTRV